MKLVFLACFFGVLLNEVLSLGYHEDVGIPEAARIKQKEAVSSRIIGGMPSANGENPYLAGLLITLTTGQLSVCGGTLLSSTKVLTAAQCWFDGYHQGRKIQVMLGSNRLFSGAWKRDVTSISVHPGFDPSNWANDLAMLTMGYSVSFSSYVKPALLPQPSEVNNTFVGASARVSGFGKTSDWSQIGPDQVQHAVSVPVIAYYDCYWALLGFTYINSNVICTSGANRWGACGGDIGGPLVIKNYYNNSSGDLLIGVTSIQSPMGCQSGFPTGYMKVTAYLSWIQSNL